jgi:hypothetical protein
MATDMDSGLRRNDIAHQMQFGVICNAMGVVRGEGASVGGAAMDAGYRGRSRLRSRR